MNLHEICECHFFTMFHELSWSFMNFFSWVWFTLPKFWRYHKVLLGQLVPLKNLVDHNKDFLGEFVWAIHRCMRNIIAKIMNCEQVNFLMTYVICLEHFGQNAYFEGWGSFELKPGLTASYNCQIQSDFPFIHISFTVYFCGLWKPMSVHYFIKEYIMAIEIAQQWLPLCWQSSYNLIFTHLDFPAHSVGLTSRSIWREEYQRYSL